MDVHLPRSVGSGPIPTGSTNVKGGERLDSDAGPVLGKAQAGDSGEWTTRGVPDETFGNGMPGMVRMDVRSRDLPVRCCCSAEPVPTSADTGSTTGRMRSGPSRRRRITEASERVPQSNQKIQCGILPAAPHD
ncbi:hypothetical protein RJ55_07718 [Drechmeria coniospora]|nr:hypothetical protein RJ55_07718 [Drechmeria coniospora]